MKVTSEPIEHGDSIELPSDPTIEVSCQSSGMAHNVFAHVVGGEPTDTYTVQITDVYESGEADINGDYVALCNGGYTRVIIVTFTKDND